MIFSKTSIDGGVEILASNDFSAIPCTVAGTDVMKAGTPITALGASTTGSNAVGILLYDVDPTVNPNAAMVVAGIIDAVKAQQHSGVTYNKSNLKSALPAVYLREDVGTGYPVAQLSTLKIGTLTLSPTFDPEEDTYTAATTNAKDAVTATAPSGITVTIELGSTEYDSGDEVSWSAGANALKVTASAPGYESTEYDVTVTKS